MTKFFCSYIFKNDTTKYHDDSTVMCASVQLMMVKQISFLCKVFITY